MSCIVWPYLECFGMHWDELAYTGVHRDAMGCTGMHWPAMDCTGGHVQHIARNMCAMSGMLWHALGSPRGVMHCTAL